MWYSRLNRKWITQLRTSLNSKNALARQFIAHTQLPLYHNAYALITNTVTTSGLGFVYWWLAARLYSQADVGWSSATISTMMLLSSLSQLNLSGALMRFVPNAGTKRTLLIGSSYAVSVLLSAGAALIFVIGRDIWDSRHVITGANSLFVIWFVLASMGWSIFALQDYAMIGLRKSVWVLGENTLFGVAKIVVLVLFASVMGRYGIFASWTIPVVLMLLPMNWLIFRRLLPAQVEVDKVRVVETLTLRKIARFVAGDYAGGLFWLLSTMSLPLLVVNRVNEAAGAYFYTAWFVGSALDMVITSMASSLVVEGAIDQEKLAHYSRDALIHILRLLAVPLIIGLIAAPLILSLFGASYAEEGATLLRLLLLGSIPRAVNALYISQARVRQHIGTIVGVQAAACVLVLGISYVLLGKIGVSAVGIAWLVGQGIVAVGIMLNLALGRRHR